MNINKYLQFPINIYLYNSYFCLKFKPMKKFVLFFLISSLFNCSSEREENIPSYSGKYFFIKNYSVIDGVKGPDNIHEGSCSGQSNYTINKDNSVIYEVFAAQSGKCKKVGTYNYSYNPDNQTMEGQDVEIEGNTMIITNVASNIKNIYYYRK